MVFSKKLKDVGVYDDFTLEKYPHGFVFYDFEVFKYDWMVVLIDPINHTKDLIVNDRLSLMKYYRTHREMVWSGYNVLHYDVPILKGILSGMDPKKISDAIIEEGKNGWSIVPSWNKFPLITYDVMVQIANAPSLKVLEAYMGSDIEETSVPFDIARQLTQDEIDMTAHYCEHDVEQTIEVFRRTSSEWDAMVNIIETFGFPFSDIEKTKAQLTAKVIGCERKEHDDEFDIRIVDTIQLKKYKYIKDWFERISKMKDYKAEIPNIPENAEILSKGKQTKKSTDSRTMFETTVCGIPHQFGWGGLHGCIDKPVRLEGKIYHVDVTSYYPSLMIRYDLLTRNCKDKKKFKEVYDIRVALKKAGKKKEQQPYKIVLNSTYGILKDRYSLAYDPVQANNVCINGQLMLLDLLEHLEGRAEIIQSNTDGIICRIADDPRSERVFRHICEEWCIRTGMGLGNDVIKFISQRDVNNYLFEFEDKKISEKMKLLAEKLKECCTDVECHGNEVLLR